MKILIFFLFFGFLIGLSLYSQDKKQYSATGIKVPVKIDGLLDENCYQESEPAKDFVQLNPYNGEPSRQKSEVWFFYDHSAIYLGALLYDSAPDSIYNFLTERDELGFSDYFGVYLDPYNQGQLAYGFFITPAGVQMDMKASRNGEFDMEDESWNAVWESATRISDQGWMVEMRIPYSAIRFPEREEHVWGLNMFRRIRRYNSNNSWNRIHRDVSGFIDQQGELTGIKNITPPVRLSFSPYAAGYVEYKGDNPDPDFIYKGGMDLKYGINESYTLDMMVIPDFGQIQSDDKELNLSPYEIFYDEKRQFFTEGTEMFSRAGLFYSRRIGAAPKFADRAEENLQSGEIVEFNPAETQLLNATKVSGRNSKGLGSGLLNAMSLPSYARIRDTLTGISREVLVQPFTNYNVAVVDKSLKNNSYLSLINTNMSMSGDPFFSNSTAYDFQLKNKKKTYALTGTGGMNVRREGETETGYGAGFGIQRIKGKLTYGVEQLVLNNKLNINDLGYLRRNNEVTTSSSVEYDITQPFSIFNELHFDLNWELQRVFKPSDLVGSEWECSAVAIFKNNYVAGLFTGLHTRRNDYYETHVSGRYFKMPGFGYVSGYLSSDSKKPLVGEIEYTRYKQIDHFGYGQMLESEINLRLGQRFRMEYDLNLQDFIDDYGFVHVNEAEDSVYFALRNVHSLENVIELSYVLNNRLGFNFRVRHYWSGAENSEYYLLEINGLLEEAPDYITDHNQNYNAFNVDMRFRWIFAPGSELSLAWKNTIYDENGYYHRDYFDNLRDTWYLGQTNSLSLKILYYIDYNRIFSRREA